MTDFFSQKKRSEVMSNIKCKDTKIEILVRKYLFNRGFRYRKNDKKLPGKPDVVLPKYKTVIFVHGCFWHRHESCKFAYIPKTRTEFWDTKINGNVDRDKENYMKLEKLGWKVIVIWECELKHNSEKELNILCSSLTNRLL